jgi:hypothetical protein
MEHSREQRREREIALQRAYRDLDRIDEVTGVTAWSQAWASMTPPDPPPWWRRVLSREAMYLVVGFLLLLHGLVDSSTVSITVGITLMGLPAFISVGTDRYDLRP